MLILVKSCHDRSKEIILTEGEVKAFGLQVIKTYEGVGGMEIQLHPFVTLALDGGEWSGPHHGRYDTEKTAPGAYRIRGSARPRQRLDTM